MVNMLRETLLEKTDFLFPSYQCIKYQCHVTSCFSVGIVSIFPSRPLGMPSLNQYKCYVCCYSLLEFINVLFLLCLREIFPSWNHLLPLALKIFLFYYIDPWALRCGVGMLMKASYLELSAPKSLTPCIFSSYESLF